MMKMHNPQFEPMGTYRLGTLLSETFASVQLSLRSILAGTQGAITTDGWTSSAGHTYYGFTYHWIEPDWKLHSVPIGISQHLGTSLALDHVRVFESELAKHGLTYANIVAITTDTAPVMNAAGRLIVDSAKDAGFHIEHVGCVDHILNITTKLAGLDPIDTPHPREEHADALLNARQMCGTFSNSSQLTARLLQFQATQAVQRPKKTIQDVKTRWWSTYSMINRLLLLKPYISYLCSRPDVELTNLNDAQWKLLGDIVIILEPFMLAQKLLEGETYVTLSLVVSIIEGLRKQLHRAASNVDNSAYVQSMLSVLTKSFTAEWGTGEADTQFDMQKTLGYRNRMQGFRMIHMLAALLDPRTKKLMTFGLLDKRKIEEELKRIAILEAKKRVAVPVPVAVPIVENAPTIVDKYRDLFNDTLPDDRHVPSADTLQYQNTDCEIAVHLEMMNYQREGVLERLTIIDGKEVHNNPLDWWKLNAGKYPILSSIARRILCVPATSAPCERLFSYAGLTISNDRNRLLPENAEEFLFLRVAWSKVDSLKRKREVT